MAETTLTREFVGNLLFEHTGTRLKFGITTGSVSFQYVEKIVAIQKNPLIYLDAEVALQFSFSELPLTESLIAGAGEYTKVFSGALRRESTGTQRTYSLSDDTTTLSFTEQDELPAEIVRYAYAEAAFSFNWDVAKRNKVGGADAVDLGTEDVVGDLPVVHLDGGTDASDQTFWRGDGIWSDPFGIGDLDDGPLHVDTGVLTVAPIDLAVDIIGNLTVAHLNAGLNASSTTFLRGDGTWASVSSGQAPVGATYITQTPNPDLTAEFSLSTLATGILRVTTGTGVLTTGLISLSSDISGNLPITNLNAGLNASTTTYWRGDGTWTTIDLSTSAVVGNLPVTRLAGGTNASAATYWRGNATWSAIDLSQLTGNLPVSRLDSGTNASITTFWRGDSTWAALTFPQIGGNLSVGQLNTGINANSTTFLRGDGTWAAIPGTPGSFAPTDAKYVVSTSDGTLTNEVVLSFLSTGPLKVTIGTGVLTSGPINLASAVEVSGNLAVSHLNSGTSASSSTFWRGDGAWATPSADAPISSTYLVASADATLTNEVNLGLLGSGALKIVVSAGTATVSSGLISLATEVSGSLPISNLVGGAAAFAPTGARYFVRTLDGTLTNQVNLGALTPNGPLRVSVTTGIATITSGAINLASEVSGNLAVSHLNTGTLADATTFWRGDGTWAIPSGSGSPTDATYIVQLPHSGLSAEFALSTLATGPLRVTTITGALTSGSVDLSTEVIGDLATSHLNSGTLADGTTFWRGDGVWAIPSGSGSPTDATYITKTLHAGLSAEFALGSLSSGILKVTTITGDLSSGLIDLNAEVSGNLDKTHLGSGTGATSSTFWRGDNTWAVPPGTGGSGAPISSTYLVASADGTLTNEVNLGLLASGPLKISVAGAVATVSTSAINLASEVTGTLPFASVASVAPVGAKYLVATLDGTLTNEVNLGLLSNGPLKVSVTAGTATITSGAINLASEVTGTLPIVNLVGGASAFAPLTAKYLVATADGTLTNDVNLGLLTPDGPLRVAVSAGTATITSGAINLATEVSGLLPIANLAGTTSAFAPFAGKYVVLQAGAIPIPPNQFALSSLGSGILKVTTGTGAITSGLVNLGPSNMEVSGLLPIANISASGSPTSSNFLRGDGTWSVPAVGASSSSKYVILTADATLPNAQNLGLLTPSGISNQGPLRVTVTAGTAVITSSDIDLANEVVGNLSTNNLNTGINATANTFWNSTGPNGLWKQIDLSTAHTIGQLPITRISATGTPSTSNFLRGGLTITGSWSAVAMTDVTGTLPVSRLTTTGSALVRTYLSGTGVWSAPPGVHDWFDVKDYGALGDGIADDGPEISDAIEACLAAGGGKVYIPRGTYLINTAIVFTSSGARWVNTNLEIELHPSATLKAKSTLTAAMVQFYGSSGNLLTITKVSGGTGYSVGDVLIIASGSVSENPATLTVLSITGGAATGPINTVSIRYVGFYTAVPSNPVTVTEGTGSGATFTATWTTIGQATTLQDKSIYIHGGTFDGTDWAYASGHDLLTIGASFSRVTIEDILFFSGNSSFDQKSDSAVATHGNTRTSIRRCVFRGSKDVGIYVSHDKEAVITECYFYGCGNGIRLKRGCKRVTIDSNHFVDCTVAIGSAEVGSDPRGNPHPAAGEIGGVSYPNDESPGIQAIITNNSMLRCVGAVDFRACDHSIISNNRILDMGQRVDGAVRDDAFGIILEGSSDCVISGNEIARWAYRPTSVVKVAGGTAYAIGNILTLVAPRLAGISLSDVDNRPTTIKVLTVSGGAILTFLVSDDGIYSSPPTNPVATTRLTGVGSGATFNLTFQISDQVGIVVQQWRDPYTTINHKSFRNLIIGNRIDGIYTPMREGNHVDTGENVFINNYETNFTAASVISDSETWMSDHTKVRKGSTVVMRFPTVAAPFIAMGAPVRLLSYTRTALPPAGSGGVGGLIYVNNAAGSPIGAVAYRDGNNWRRIDTAALV